MAVLNQTKMREMARITELKAYGILDTANEPIFDEIVKRAACKFGAPIALISLIDENRQWFKARHGLLPQETPRTISFCTHAIRGSGVFVVDDAQKDERFKENPLVTDDPHIRFYAGAPLKTHGGKRIGTLCIIDRVVREQFSEAARVQLEQMALEVMTAIEARARTKTERAASGIHAS